MSLKLYSYKVHTNYFDRVMNVTACKVKVANIVGDIFIWGKIQEEHYLKLKFRWENVSNYRSMVTM